MLSLTSPTALPLGTHRKWCLGLLAATALSSTAEAAITYTLHLDGVDAGIADQVSQATAEAVALYNAHGQFDKHLHVYWNAGVPTAQANYDGVMTFGGQRNTRVALHEISHTLGIGTYWNYWNLMVNGAWQGQHANTLLASFDGAGAQMRGDSMHIWPYGLNYDSEDSYDNRIRHIRIVAAMRCDMGIGSCESAVSDDPLVGSNRVITNRATGLVLDAIGNDNGADMIIYQDWGNPNQRWQINAVGDGTYTFTSMQANGRALDTWNWGTTNGTRISLYDAWNGDPQRFTIEEVESGWYRITPAIAPDQCVHAHGFWNAAPVVTWQWWGGHNQQWSIQ